MKKISIWLGIVLLSLLLIPFGQGTTKAAGSSIQLILEGKTVTSDVPPKLYNGRTFVPIRVIADGFHTQVQWDGNQRTVSISGEKVAISMQIGNKSANVNGQEVAMDVPPIIDGGRTLVPLRFVGESLGATVGWMQDTQSVVVNKVYQLQINGNKQDGSIYHLGDELYFPLKEISSYLNMQYNSSPDGDDSVAYQSKTINIQDNGVGLWKLKKIGDIWFIPQSVMEKQLSAQVLPAEQTAPVKQQNELSSISFQNDKITLNTTMASTPQMFTMKNPDRLVLDLPDTILSAQLRNSTLFQNGLGTVSLNQNVIPAIKEIRYSQYSSNPDTIRVVVELSQRSKYNMVTTKDGIVLTIQPFPKKEGFLIVLDPGHGGKDPGAKGVAGNVEKDLTLAVSKLVKEDLLKIKGFQVVETRNDDSYPTLQDRVQLAEDVDADLFLCIHANSFQPETRGTETYYDTPQSEEFARIVHKHLLGATGFPDRGERKSGFYVIKNTTMPSTLVEIGFLTNEEENRQMLDPGFQQKVAKALADAVYEYYTSQN